MTSKTKTVLPSTSENLLGYVTWFSVNQSWVTPSDLEQWFTDLDIDEDHLPPKLKPREAFRRAFSPDGVEYNFVRDPARGQTVTLRCEEVKLPPEAGKERSVRRVVAKEYDQQHSQIAFDVTVAEVTYFNATEKIAVKNLASANADALLAQHVSQYLAELQASFDRRCTHLDSDAIRRVIRNIVVGMNSTQLSDGGGVYFVHATREATLRKLQELAQRCSPRTRLTCVALPNDPEQRDMVGEAYVHKFIQKADSLLERVVGLTKQTEVKKREADNAVSSMIDLKTSMREYVTSIGLKRDRAEAALELVEDALADVWEKVK